MPLRKHSASVLARAAASWSLTLATTCTQHGTAWHATARHGTARHSTEGVSPCATHQHNEKTCCVYPAFKYQVPAVHSQCCL